MSGEKASSPCGKFQANIFNKSKCQNCFKSRELHLLSERDLEQAKPIYGGWLCLAPEGTDFDNPIQRSRKWQRRFFILYEDGSLSFALDELPSTLPQGTVSMTLCTDIADAEPRTGQRNALFLVTPEQEIFIRGDNKEIINGWSEQLVVYLQTNRLSQKKKRKVEAVTSQEPSPAKISATNSGFPSSAVGRGESAEQDGRPDETPVWTVTDPRGDSRPSDAAASNAGPMGSADPRANGSRRPDRSSSAERLQGSKASRKDQAGDAAGCRKGRSEACSSTREKLQSCGDVSQLTAAPPPRRSKSLDRRTSDTIMTPDLLNFKKGWMVKLDEDDQWKKSWFVLSTDSLRYYRDSVAEEASDLEGEIDLTKCFGVSEYQVQRNYGFQIHTQSGVFTLSAMTAGIRKNWIQALMKNVHPAKAPDVTSSPGHHVSSRTPEVLPRPDVTQDSPCAAPPAEPHPRSVADKRRDGRYRTFDWAEFRPQSEPPPPPPPDPPGSPHRPLELLDVERRKRREERRRRYENMLGISLGHQETGGTGGVQALRVEEEMEECWRLVEKIMFRPEKTIPLITERRDSAETETMLHSYRQAVEDLKEQLAESQRCRLKLEAQLSAAGFYQQQLDRPDFCLSDSIKQQSLTESRGLVSPEQPEEPPSPPSPPQLPSIWLQDTQGNLLELQETPLLSPASDDQHRLNSDLQAHLDEDDLQQTEVQEVFDDSSHQVEVKRLSKEVELLTGQNEALNQRNQEMLNQLTEADREIERLKAELSSRYTEPRLLPEAEQQEKSRLEDLEVELNLRNQELLEAQALVASLEDNLREAEALLQQAEDVEDGADKAEGYLLRCFEATEAKLTELETQLRQSKQQNVQLKEAEQLHRHRASEAAADVRRLSEELEQERTRHREGNRGVSGEEKIQQVMEAMAARRRALGRLLEVIDRLDFVTEEESQLKREEQFWSLVLHKVKDPADQLLSEVTQQMMLERQMLLLLSDRDDFQDMVWSSESVSAPQSERCAFALEKKQLQCVTQMKISLLSRIGSSVISSTRSSHLHQLQLAVDRLHDSCPPQQLPSTSVLHSAATEALYCCWLMELQSRPEHHGRLVPASLDASCQTEEVEDEQEEVEDEQEEAKDEQGGVKDEQEEVVDEQEGKENDQKDMEDKQEEVENEQKDVEDEQEEVEDEQKDVEDEQKDMEDEQKDMEDEQQEVEDKQEDLQEVEPEVSRMETQQNFEECDERDPNVLVTELTEKLTELQEDEQENLHVDQQENLQEVDQKVKQEVEPELSGMEALELDPNILISELTERLAELQEQMSELKQEFEAELSRLRTEHQKETDKLKATCERGFSSMEDAQAKVVVELQRRHQLEVERLLLERDRLLEEESTATATAIEAIKNAHRLELQRELERRERSSGGTHLEDVYRQHSEELASYQRELEVLSQQFCLKCLENGHLVQAVDAERKALCQCQQENQDLRTRNQELSGHLAAEITRLCSLAKQDALPLSQGMDLYEMEITLRVKESEVQCLKQEITSLKDEMQSAQKDKRNATKKYKDMYTELSIVRAKAQQDADELRENLRLAHQALGQSSP